MYNVGDVLKYIGESEPMVPNRYNPIGDDVLFINGNKYKIIRIRAGILNEPEIIIFEGCKYGRFISFINENFIKIDEDRDNKIDLILND